jgi:hypothetical protein
VLCDCRADSEALNAAFGLRLAGAIDIQIAHAALSGQIDPSTTAAAAAGAPIAQLPFFFPTGLARLASVWCGLDDSLLANLKHDFGAAFNTGARPFRTLPLTAAAASYAASDAWHIWAVYSALWPAVMSGALEGAVRRLSDTRSSEFRDAPGGNGREAWEERLAVARAERAASARLERRREGGESPAVAREPKQSKRKRGGEDGAASGMSSRENGAEGLVPQPAKRARVVSGPHCACCGIAFTGAAQLLEHEGGKRHKSAMAVAGLDHPPPLLIECRQAQLRETELRAALQAFGDLSSVNIQAQEGASASGGANGGKPVQQGASGASSASGGKPAPWRATVHFSHGSGAARALGARAVYVTGGDGAKKRVHVETAREL